MHRSTPLCEHTHVATSCSQTPLPCFPLNLPFSTTPSQPFGGDQRRHWKGRGFTEPSRPGTRESAVGIMLDPHICFQTHPHMQPHAAPRTCAPSHTQRSSCAAARVKASTGMHAHQVTCCSELQAWPGHPTPSGPLPSRVPFGFEMEPAKTTGVQAGFPQTFRLAPNQPQFQLDGHVLL